MLENFKSQRGLTLVEVLISIVLLSIFLTSLLGFFTQSAMFTKKSEQKLGTLQTAQMVVNMIEENVTRESLRLPLKDINGIVLYTTPITDGTGAVNSNMQPANGTFLLKDKGELESLLKKTITTNYSVSTIISNDTLTVNDTDPSKNTYIKLIKFKVMVIDPNNAASHTETHTYIRK
ncbi:prepilin-type N-terminal cleavage/methylation domain-containing protein [Neobacillus citreus]|uniref:Prepilin-type N-terminal cleavage/methylation domain-containing protein n=1 Tax=Neobacillus citreus TaxID=2833578 RepID=A0A942T4C3_9BACI|nr:prepilin-type N-terminal cleavage/methylation domain-containing protein [Neobacillus citreus]MCH6266686.1 prepilin-type N-terminal cleavage/methylation domain-containing protein [Neobacillus citreus]